MKQLSIMIKPASSLCNMRCRYCFYADVSSLREVQSFGQMSKETLDNILKHIFMDLEPGDKLTLAFQGGEPTLVGLEYFQYLTQQVENYASREIEVHYALQTNGLLLDQAWCAFLKKHQFLVGLSLDGPAEFHDANRLDAERRGTFRRIMNAKRALEREGTEYNVLMVLTGQMARHPQKIWRFIQEQKINFVQFIPCLGPLDGEESPYALTPERYAAFYTVLFDLWFYLYQQGKYISVKLFDDLVHLLAFGQCNACGLLGQCQVQMIVEADGSVYPCDFYVLDEFRAGNLAEEALRSVYQSPVMQAFVHRPEEEKRLCVQCPYQNICNAGCQRMRHEIFFRPGDNVCGHRLFLDSSIHRLQQLAYQQRVEQQAQWN
ncbi:MAG: radical SAM protein [Lawsonibacter sp.]|jgi:uncharacterized protein